MLRFLRCFERFILTFCLCILSFQTLDAQSLTTSDSLQYHPERDVRCMLLTFPPEHEVYARFGHSALAFTDGTSLWIYNYGLFDFAEPHFVLKFILGHTYYWVMPEDGRYLLERGGGGYAVTRLNFTPAEVARLDSLLADNCRPEHCRYLYNFFDENCATRLRDKIEQASATPVTWQMPATPSTYREELHTYLRDASWLRLGIDLLLGSPADKPIPTPSAWAFLPTCLERMLLHTTRPDGTSLGTQIAAMPFIATPPIDYTAPIFIGMLSLVLVALSVVQICRRRYTLPWIDVLLFVGVSLCGTLVLCVSWFSIHPAVFPNHVLWTLHPLWWLFPLLRGKAFRAASLVQSVFFVLFLTMGLFVQCFPPELWMLTLALVARLYTMAHLAPAHHPTGFRPEKSRPGT